MLIVLTDGDDTSSKATLAQVTRPRTTPTSSIYAIALKSPDVQAASR